MSNDAFGRTPRGFFTDINERIDILERRLAAQSVPAPVFNAGAIAASLTPQDFEDGITFGQADTGFPNTVGTVLVVHHSDTRAYQEFHERGSGTGFRNRSWVRMATESGLWGPFQLESGGLGWENISSSFLDATVEIKQDGPDMMIRGLCNTDVATGTGSQDITSTPIDSIYRPSSLAVGVAYVAGMSPAVFLRSNGTIAVANRNAITITASFNFSIAYKLD